MSQRVDYESTIITGLIEKVDLSIVPMNRYWFELSKLPLSKSLIIEFENENHVRTSECSINYITDETINSDEIDGINYINYDSPLTNDYAKILIDTSFIENDKIVYIKEDNYLNYKSKLIDKIFLDFSLSEQICSILDTVDLNGNRVCNHFTATYFYQI